MKDGLVEIELTNSGGTTLSTGKDVLDWRKTSIVHKAWEKEAGAPFVGKLRRAIFPRGARSSAEERDHTQERHHNYNGRPWCLGRDHIEYLVRRGLKPEHRFLDLGCGAMRTGVWVAKFLNPGCYFGIDAHLPALEAAASYEIPLHGLQEKKPRLFNNDQFDLGHFGVKFDFVFAFAVVNHLSDEMFDLAFRRIRENMQPTGRLVLSPRPRMSTEWIEREHGLELCHSEEVQCLFIDDTITFFEFQLKMSNS